MNSKPNHEKSSAVPASVQKVSNSPAPGGRISSTAVDHWKARVYLPSKSSGGVSQLGTIFVVKIQFAGRRETFNLHTSSRDTAARTARDIYVCLVQQGWGAAMSRFKPKPAPKPQPTDADTVLTVGRFLTALEKSGLLNMAGLISYRTKLRTVMGAISEVGSGRRPGIKHKAWRAEIDALPVALLTPTAFKKLRDAYAAKDPEDPKKRTSARRTFDNLLRHIRSIFRDEIRTELAAKGITLPPCPCVGIKFFIRGKTSYRYVSTFSVESLIQAATKDLKSTQPDLFLAFVLAVVLGLRRNEIDKLKWSSVAWAEKELRVIPNEFFAAKRENSERRVALDDGTLAVLRSAYEKKTDDWVLLSKNEPRLNKTYRHYRCEHTFGLLCDWLRTKGVKTNCPVHTLRKEAGSRVNDEQGIIAAKDFLGHASPEVTWTYYVAEKAPKPNGLGALLT